MQGEEVNLTEQDINRFSECKQINELQKKKLNQKFKKKTLEPDGFLKPPHSQSKLQRSRKA